ncbi:glyoxalase 3 [Exaiptasia diaphana]|uniref:DJ-1/PfpI domain-containing protein n=1 Tax=Exaiptasia diaphana TaxID=2652724 RepID=A0A913XRD9_EXADI|nr:glyoxalase 3 [Exaiptasia diaphana]KXJ25183.1 Glyoxalase 3 [Exaiptasia diaphana]
MVKVLLLVTNHGKMGNLDKKTGWYLPEVAHPYKVFKEAGYEIIMTSPKGGDAPMDPSSYEQYRNDEDCQMFLADYKIQDNFLKDTVPLDKVDLKSCDVFFCAGGHGPMFDLPDNDLVNNSVTAVYEKGGVAAAVCHGPAGIVNTKLSNGEYLVKGKKVTCFTNSEEDEMNLSQAMPFMLETRLKEHGAVFNAAPNWQANVEVCDRVITGQNPNSATPIAQAIVKELQKSK